MPHSAVPDTAAAASSTAEVDQVCRAAAQAAPALAAMPPRQRAELLVALAERLRAHEREIVALADSETLLGSERLAGELVRTTGQLALFADALRDGSVLDLIFDAPVPDAVPAPRPDVRRWLVPLGPVGVFAASNFPLAFSVAGGDTASALAAGCPVVVKAHPGHPRLSALVGQLAADVLPAGALAVVHGQQAGRDLVTHPRITAVSFTGSTSGGRALFDLAGGRPDPIPFYGELGSINPVVVTPHAAEARREELVSGFVGALTLGNGQFCTKPGLLFLPAGHGWDDRLAAAVTSVPAAPMLGAWVSDGFAAARDRLANTPGVRVVAAGAVSEQTEAQTATLTPPSLFATSASAFVGTPAMAEEAFGPAALIVEYDSVEDLERALATLPGSLTATVHAEPATETDLARQLVTLLSVKAGRIVWAGWPTGVAVGWATQHGGPWPAALPSTHTSVGVTAIRRFQRPVAYQNLPDELLPQALRDSNPLGLRRRSSGAPDSTQATASGGAGTGTGRL